MQKSYSKKKSAKAEKNSTAARRETARISTSGKRSTPKTSETKAGAVGGELRINLRLPDDLYAKVAKAAKGKGVTPAEFCRVTLANALVRPFSSACGESHQKPKKATCGSDCYKNAEATRIQVKPPTTPKGVAAEVKAKAKNGRTK